MKYEDIFMRSSLFWRVRYLPWFHYSLVGFFSSLDYWLDPVPSWLVCLPCRFGFSPHWLNSSLHWFIGWVPSLIFWILALLTGFSSLHRIVVWILSLICWIVALLTGFFTSLAYWLDPMSCLLDFCLVDRILYFFGLLARFHVLFAGFFLALLTGLFSSVAYWLDSMSFYSLHYFVGWIPCVIGYYFQPICRVLRLIGWIRCLICLVCGQLCLFCHGRWPMWPAFY